MINNISQDPSYMQSPVMQNALATGLCRRFTGNEMMHFGGQSAVKLGTMSAFLIIWVDLSNQQGYYFLREHCVPGLFVTDDEQQSAYLAKYRDSLRNHMPPPSPQNTGYRCK
jgi:hypothetical protein